jgi:hypothetical protein
MQVPMKRPQGRKGSLATTFRVRVLADVPTRPRSVQDLTDSRYRSPAPSKTEASGAQLHRPSQRLEGRVLLARRPARLTRARLVARTGPACQRAWPSDGRAYGSACSALCLAAGSGLVGRETVEVKTGGRHGRAASAKLSHSGAEGKRPPSSSGRGRRPAGPPPPGLLQATGGDISSGRVSACPRTSAL